MCVFVCLLHYWFLFFFVAAKNHSICFYFICKNFLIFTSFHIYNNKFNERITSEMFFFSFFPLLFSILFFLNKNDLMRSTNCLIIFIPFSRNTIRNARPKRKPVEKKSREIILFTSLLI